MKKVDKKVDKLVLIGRGQTRQSAFDQTYGHLESAPSTKAGNKSSAKGQKPTLPRIVQLREENQKTATINTIPSEKLISAYL